MGSERLLPACRLLCFLSAVGLAAVSAGCQSGGNGYDQGAVPASANLAPSPPPVSANRPDGAYDAADEVLADPFGSGVLEAVVIPPAGWNPDPLKRTGSHAHQAWISPSGRTAYGVIRMNLPLPFIGPSVVLPRFIDEMRATEGEAKLLSRRDDPRLPGIRFVAEGGQYRLRTNLMTRGFRAWAVYAGTLRAEPEMPDELAIAEAAREGTRIGTTRVRAANR
jgi:hypothetical protein